MAAGAASRTTERALAGMVRRCYAGLDTAGLRDEIATGLRRVLTVDAAFIATVDPLTLLFTGMVVDDPLTAAGTRFLDNEFGGDDVNTFTGLAAAADPVDSLDRVSAGDRAVSARYRDIMAPLGLGDELRAALRSGGHCWGVLCLHREDGPAGFGARDLGLVRRLAPHLGEGLRRAVVRELAEQTMDEAGPGMLVLGEDGEVEAATTAAQYWLAQLPDDAWSARGGLPVPVQAAIAALDHPGARPGARVRVPTRTGSWLSISADRLTGAGAPRTGVLLEPAAPAELSAMHLRAFGLTPAQERVAALILRGRSTKQIAGDLHISANTVQEHVSGVFDKVGVRSRRELAAYLLSPH
jgi:DNA-binding CsgD family transcriptional regulator